MTHDPLSSYSFSHTLWKKIIPIFLGGIFLLFGIFFIGENFFLKSSEDTSPVNEEITKTGLESEKGGENTLKRDEEGTNNSSDDLNTNNSEELSGIDISTDRIILNSAHEKRDYSLCLNISSAALQKQCLDEKESYISKTASDENQCKEISDTEKKYLCLRRFLTEEDFESFSDNPSQCTDQKWKLESDEEFCFKMSISSAFSSGKTINCADFSGEILDFCRKKEREVSDFSFFEKAEETLNYEYCEKITDEKEQKKCKDGVLFSAAWEKKDSSLCVKIQDEELKRKCQKEQVERIDSFFYRKAKLEKNNLLCIKISHMDLQKKCIQFFQK